MLRNAFENLATESTLDSLLAAVDALNLACAAIKTATETLAGRTLDTSAVSGTVALDAPSLAALETVQVGNWPAIQAVNTGLEQPLTDAQLRAAALPLPAGASSEVTLASIAAAVRDGDSAGLITDPGLVLLARRVDGTATADADGDYVTLAVDAAGRLKVSAAPPLIARLGPIAVAASALTDLTIDLGEGYTYTLVLMSKTGLASAGESINARWSDDGLNWFNGVPNAAGAGSLAYNGSSSASMAVQARPLGRYLLLQYANGSTAQTQLRLAIAALVGV